MKIVFIINGSKKKGFALSKELHLRKESKHLFETRHTQYTGHAIEIAKQCASEFDVLCAVGGDGTLHECVNGLMQHRAEKDTNKLPQLALIPMGSGNDFIRNFSIEFNIENLFEKIEKSQVQNVDVCFVERNRIKKEYFINIASVGFGPSVVDRVNRLPSGWGGGIKFGIGILSTFFAYRRSIVHIKCEEFQWTGKPLILAFANGKFFGSGVGIAPQAIVNDGWISVTIVGKVSVFDYFLQLRKLKRCQAIAHKEVLYFKTKELLLETHQALELDGELFESQNDSSTQVFRIGIEEIQLNFII